VICNFNKGGLIKRVFRHFKRTNVIQNKPFEIKENRNTVHILYKHRAKVASVSAFAIVAVIIGFILASTSITDITPNRGTSRCGQTIIITGNGFTDYTVGTPTNFTGTGCSLYTIPADGYYQLETWGAQGGNAGAFASGRGGYSVGTVYLAQGTQVWACVGGQGSQATRTDTAPYPGGANGGGGAFRTDNGNGRETASGGGGTDFRIGVNSLYARVIVAGGGWFGGGSGLAAAGGSGFIYTANNIPNAATIGSAYLLGSQHQMFNTSMATGSPADSMPAPGGAVHRPVKWATATRALRNCHIL